MNHQIQINQTPINTWEVKFQYKPWIVLAMKQIPGSRYNGASKIWTIPESSSDALLNWAKGLGITPSESAKPIDYTEIDELPELTIDIPLKKELFEFQKNGVAYAIDKKRLIIGDQPGLGKTAQAIATVEGAGCKCILIICPATIRENWKREIEEKWTNRKALILSDRVKSSWVQFYKVGMIKYFIVNYESLKKYFVSHIDEHFDENGKKKPIRLNHIHFNETISIFDAVIIDEIHRCKDGKTKQSKFTMGICKGKEYIIAMTGTPVVNKPIDLIPQLHIIQQLDKFGGYKGFVDKFCQGVNQASNLSELNYLLYRHCFYRRLKQDVLKDLPAKMRNIVKVNLTNQAEYNKAEERFIDYLRENLNKTEGEITVALRGAIMVQIGILKKIAARGKLFDVIDHINEINEAEEKFVLFAWHKEIVSEVKKMIPEVVTLVGDDSMDARQHSVDSFQNNPKVLTIVCNIKSGGVGITLTSSSRMGFIELPWHPADADQCEDRCHRIGQKDSVECTYFIGNGTIDEYIYEIIERKRGIANAITGDNDEVETSVIDEFISKFAQDKINNN